MLVRVAPANHDLQGGQARRNAFEVVGKEPCRFFVEEQGDTVGRNFIHQLCRRFCGL